jgi:eukaryotic-like serine/threonine-protein kinase
MQFLDHEATSPVRLNPEIPPKLEEIINKCLEKDRETRCQSAAELRADLKRLKRHTETGRSTAAPVTRSSEDASAGLPSSTARGEVSTMGHATISETNVALGLLARHRSAFFAFAVVAILIIAGLGYGAHRWLTPASGSSIDTLAVLPFVNVTGNPDSEYLSDGLTESLLSSLSQLPALAVRPRSSVFHYKSKDVDPLTVARDLKVGAIITGRHRLGLGRC